MQTLSILQSHRQSCDNMHCSVDAECHDIDPETFYIEIQCSVGLCCVTKLPGIHSLQQCINYPFMYVDFCMYFNIVGMAR